MNTHALVLTLRIVTSIVALAILLNLLDDLFIDLNYFLRGLYRRSRRRLTRAELVSQTQQRIAIIVPAWKEADVIAEMLSHNLSSLDYDPSRYMIFCGTYQNDPGTQACVDAVARRSPSVRKVVVPHDGPTSKADCLNWVYQGVILEEERSGERFGILLMHDAEDIIHPLAPRLYNYLIPRYEFVQTPVFSLDLKAHQIVAGTYIDEFAEHHLKDMLVREAIGGLVPSAGVGSAFCRDAFEEIATAHDQKPFNVDSLTEDYELAIKFRLANKRVHFACRTLERPAEADGVIGTREEYLATREYFPSGFTASIRQRSRWVCGITLQTWQQVGWKGSLPVLYCLWRDRKAVFTNLMLLLAYSLGLCFAASSGYAVLTDSPWLFERVVQPGSLLSLLLWLNTGALIWRALLKAYFVGRLYGPVQALLSAPRLIAGNLISVLATLRALKQYVGHRVTGEPLRWLKTAHQFPNARTLRARARMLGECLIESGLLSEQELQQALLLQRGTSLPLGAILTLAGLCSAESVANVLSEQWGLESSPQIETYNIPLGLLRALPELIAERLDVLPLTAAGDEVSVAVARQLTLQERSELEGLLGARLRPCVVDASLLAHARQRAYRRLLEPAALGQPAARSTRPLGERLLAAGHVSRADLEHALAEQHHSGELLGELLQRKALVTASTVADAIALYGCVPGDDLGEPDAAAIAQLGYGFCALYSMVPMRASPERLLLAAAFPLPESVLERVRGELNQTERPVYAPLFRVRSWLAQGHRARMSQPGMASPNVGPLDACELEAIARHESWRGSVQALWDACRAAAQAPIDYLQTIKQIGAAEAARLRSLVYGVDLAEAERGAQPPATSLLPPSLSQRHGISVLAHSNNTAILAAARPTPELARMVARCLPTWAIAWRVASPQPTAAKTPAKVHETWNKRTTTN